MVVKLASLKADLERELKGDWVDHPDYPGVSFNVSSLLHSAYQIDRVLLTQRLARQNKGKPTSPETLMTETGKLYAKHILHGWRGFDVEYSAAKASEMLADPEWRNLVAAVEWCAAKISDFDVEYVDDAIKKLRAAFQDRLRKEGLSEGTQDWLEQLAGEYPDNDWVQRAAYPEGRFDYTPEPWHELYWDAWRALGHERQHYASTGGPGPLSYMAVSRYAQDHGIVGDDFWIFRRLMNELDAEWLKYVADRSRTKGG